MYKRFKQLLLSLQSRSMEEQKLELDRVIEEWKAYDNPEGGVFEQIDDIIIIGVRHEEN